MYYIIHTLVYFDAQVDDGLALGQWHTDQIYRTPQLRAPEVAPRE